MEPEGKAAGPADRFQQARAWATFVCIVLLVVAVVAGLVQHALSRPTPIKYLPLAPTSEIKVSVRGAVVRPGVYSLQEGDRVDDAIRSAGGMLPGADSRSVNPAARLYDEQDIVVLRTGEPSPASSPALPTATILPASGQSLPPTPSTAPANRPRVRANLNSATFDELVALPGIADFTANRIIDSRQRVGPFQSVADLLERGLMNQQNFDRVKDFVTAR